VEIVNFIDDHSRLAVASRVLARASAPAVLEIFRAAGERWGLPAALLTDNGCVYTTWHRGGPNVMQTELLGLGIDYRHSRVGAGVRVRRDRIDKHGRVTLRHRTKLHHIGIGARHRGKRVILLVKDLDVRVVALDGEMLRHLTLDPSRGYQPQGS
jgi:hypothetical protein